MRLEPNNVVGYANLGQNFLALNRLDDAKATFEQALARKLDGGSLRLWMYYLAFLRRRLGADGAAVGLGGRKAGSRRPAALRPVRYRSVLRPADKSARLTRGVRWTRQSALIPRRRLRSGR